MTLGIMTQMIIMTLAVTTLYYESVERIGATTLAIMTLRIVTVVIIIQYSKMLKNWYHDSQHNNTKDNVIMSTDICH